jgi:hypothetical protein
MRDTGRAALEIANYRAISHLPARDARRHRVSERKKADEALREEIESKRPNGV